eukprot:6284709-Karenia_brevis.AAC.1
MDIDKVSAEEKIDIPLSEIVKMSKTPVEPAPAKAPALGAPASSMQGIRAARERSRGVSMPRHSQEDVLKGLKMNEEGKR